MTSRGDLPDALGARGGSVKDLLKQAGVRGDALPGISKDLTMKKVIRRNLVTLILLGSIVPVTASVQIINRVTFSTTFPGGARS
jgi:hypothetical protein